MALATPDYVAQPFDQDAWIALDARLSGREALDAFVALARMNGSLFEGLSAAHRATPLTHPGIRRADGRLDHPSDGGPSDSPSEAARTDRLTTKDAKGIFFCGVRALRVLVG